MRHDEIKRETRVWVLQRHLAKIERIMHGALTSRNGWRVLRRKQLDLQRRIEALVPGDLAGADVIYRGRRHRCDGAARRCRGTAETVWLRSIAAGGSRFMARRADVRRATAAD